MSIAVLITIKTEITIYTMNVIIKKISKSPTFIRHKLKYPILQVPVISPLPIKSVCFIQRRNYCDHHNESQLICPLLMDFPKISQPSFIKSFINRLIGNIIIKFKFDEEFVIDDFIEASKHAVQVVSENLKNSDFNEIGDLVTKNALTLLKASIAKMTVSQRHQLVVDKNDILSARPYQVRIFLDDANRQWVQITMCYSVLRGISELMSMMEEESKLSSVKRHELQPLLLNYRFIKEFTEGVEDSWHIDLVNHYTDL